MTSTLYFYDGLLDRAYASSRGGSRAAKERRSGESQVLSVSRGRSISGKAGPVTYVRGGKLDRRRVPPAWDAPSRRSASADGKMRAHCSITDMSELGRARARGGSRGKRLCAIRACTQREPCGIRRLAVGAVGRVGGTKSRLASVPEAEDDVHVRGAPLLRLELARKRRGAAQPVDARVC